MVDFISILASPKVVCLHCFPNFFLFNFVLLSLLFLRFLFKFLQFLLFLLGFCQLLLAILLRLVTFLFLLLLLVLEMIRGTCMNL